MKVIIHFLYGMKMKKKVSKTGWKIKKSHPLAVKIGNWLLATIIIVAISFTLIFFWGRQVILSGQSMEPRLHHGDVCLINGFKGSLGLYKRGDIILFYPQGDNKLRPSIKRIVGLPGEKVKIQDQKLYIEDKILEGYPQFETIEFAGKAAEEITLEKDEYFVLGDNLKESEDSRSNIVGNIKKRDMIGSIWFIISPKEHQGFLE